MGPVSWMVPSANKCSLSRLWGVAFCLVLFSEKATTATSAAATTSGQQQEYGHWRLATSAYGQRQSQPKAGSSPGQNHPAGNENISHGTKKQSHADQQQSQDQADHHQPGTLEGHHKASAQRQNGPALQGPFVVVDACDGLQNYRQHGLHSSTCQPALNILDQDSNHCHHPIFTLMTGMSTPLHHWPQARLSLRGNPPAKLVSNTVVEESGLLVPYEFDCTLWNASTQPYSSSVPSRWKRCAEQHAWASSGLHRHRVELPLVDEEYMELIAVYQSVLRAQGSYHVVELGARWGTWGLRALALLHLLRPSLPHSALFVEPESAADGIHEVVALNLKHSRFKAPINYKVIKGLATANDLLDWSAHVPQIDLLDVDIQHAEVALMPELADLLVQKVVRLALATHDWSSDTHGKMLTLLRDKLNFTIAHEYKGNGVGAKAECVAKTFRKNRDFEGVVREGCTADTPWGPVCQSDGEIVADNPRFAPQWKAARAAAERKLRRVQRRGVRMALATAEGNDEPATADTDWEERKDSLAVAVGAAAGAVRGAAAVGGGSGPGEGAGGAAANAAADYCWLVLPAR